MSGGRKPSSWSLDACRSLVRSGRTKDEEAQSTRLSSGSRLFTKRQPPRNFLVLYSAAFGEQAVESLSAQDPGRNSLFTEVLRSEMMRPGQSLKDLAERVKLMVRATAQDYGEQQEPEYVSDGPNPRRDVSDRADRRANGSRCPGKVRRRRGRLAGDQEPAQARATSKRHIRRFDTCDTAEWRGSRLAELGLSADDSDAFQDAASKARTTGKRSGASAAKEIQRTTSAALLRISSASTAARRRNSPGASLRHWRRQAKRQADMQRSDQAERRSSIATCWQLPTSIGIGRRSAGLPFEKVVADDAIAACKALVEDRNNELNPRFQFNLGRAYHKRGE